MLGMINLLILFVGFLASWIAGLFNLLLIAEICIWVTMILCCSILFLQCLVDIKEKTKKTKARGAKEEEK